MFAPFDSILEDPAISSACCALAALLIYKSELRDEKFEWRIAQGIEMGRPGFLYRILKLILLLMMKWISMS